MSRVIFITTYFSSVLFEMCDAIPYVATHIISAHFNKFYQVRLPEWQVVCSPEILRRTMKSLSSLTHAQRNLRIKFGSEAARRQIIDDFHIWIVSNAKTVFSHDWNRRKCQASRSVSKMLMRRSAKMQIKFYVDSFWWDRAGRISRQMTWWLVKILYITGMNFGIA